MSSNKDSNVIPLFHKQPTKRTYSQILEENQELAKEVRRLTAIIEKKKSSDNKNR